MLFLTYHYADVWDPGFLREATPTPESIGRSRHDRTFGQWKS